MLRYAKTIVVVVALLLALHLSGPGHATTSSQKPLQTPNFFFDSPTPLNGSYTTVGFDLDPTSVVTSDGNLWVAWESNRAGSYQIYYQTFSGLSWTVPSSISTAAYNNAPGIAQLANGTVIVVWAAGTNGNDNHLVYRTFTNGVWGTITQLTSGANFVDEYPKTTVRGDGTLWVIFERDNSTGPSTPPIRQIYYKTLTGNVWSPDLILTTDSAQNQMPAVTVLKGSNVWVAWMKSPTAGGNSTLYYRTYNGTRWSPDTSLTSPGVMFTPSIVQDRNGTMYAFWIQTMHANATITQDQVMYRSSTDIGATWTPVSNLTLWGDSNNPVNNLTPFSVQAPDTSLYTFFATDVPQPVGFGFHIYYMKSSSIFPVHSLAITNVRVSQTKMYPYGDNPVSITQISVTILNPGDFVETNIPLTVVATNKTTTTILNGHFSTLNPNIPVTLSFPWNVTGYSPARYTITASIPVLPTETTGNSLGHVASYKSVAVHYAGDVLRHGKVDIFDLSVCAYAYQSTPSSPKYNGDCDVKRNYIIDIFDMSVMASNYQKSI